MAGDSADEVARRARDKAERLLRNAEMWEKGAAGERAVQEALAQLPPEWTVFHDLHWPGRQRANIDHLVIGPGGVFVIDAKNWSGQLQVRDGILRQNGYRRDAAVDSARAAARSIASLASSLPAAAVIPVLCFTGEAVPQQTTLDGVSLCSVSNLVALIVGRPAAISPDGLSYLRFELDMSTRAATGPAVDLPRLPPPAPVGRSRPSTRSVRTVKRQRTPRSVRRTVKRFIFGFGLWIIATLIANAALGSARNNSSVAGPVLIGLGVAAFIASRRVID
ncbi:nuclease-related domain-containing protein [Nocardioides sp. DS6]|uniref:Nuclease-related domain-containing protein n=1 Tax=Nocardioides eburneus TaxID=3231482 RepID=A0ABV3T261_9ACTN